MRKRREFYSGKGVRTWVGLWPEIIATDWKFWHIVRNVKILHPVAYYLLPSQSKILIVASWFVQMSFSTEYSLAGFSFIGLTTTKERVLNNKYNCHFLSLFWLTESFECLFCLLTFNAKCRQKLAILHFYFNLVQLFKVHIRKVSKTKHWLTY